MNQANITLTAGQRRCIYLGLIIPIGFLAADSFANAAGFPTSVGQNKEMGVFLRIMAGVVVAIAALAILVLLRHAFVRVLDYLGRVTAKPHVAVAIALLVCGTICILGMLVFEYLMVSQSSLLAMSSRAQMGMESAEVSFQVRVPLLTHLIAACAFLSGAALLALGVWSSVVGLAAPVVALEKP